MYVPFKQQVNFTFTSLLKFSIFYISVVKAKTVPTDISRKLAKLLQERAQDPFDDALTWFAIINGRNANFTSTYFYFLCFSMAHLIHQPVRWKAQPHSMRCAEKPIHIALEGELQPSEVRKLPNWRSRRSESGGLSFRIQRKRRSLVSGRRPSKLWLQMFSCCSGSQYVPQAERWPELRWASVCPDNPYWVWKFHLRGTRNPLCVWCP